MKKIIIIAIALCFCAVSSIAWMNVVTVGVGVPSGGGGVDCPSFYESAILSWDGDYPSDTDTACETDGDSVQGSQSGGDLGTDYGESGSVGFKVDAANEHISYSQTADQYIDDLGAVTIWMRVYFSALPTGDTAIFFAYSATSSYVLIIARSSGEFIGIYRDAATSNSVYSPSSISAESWVDIAYSYDRASANTHTFNTGGSWKADEADSLSTSTVGNISKIEIGETDEGASFSMGVGEYYQITQWAIVNGYKAAKPW